MILLQQSVASQEVPLGIFVDATDGDTEESGLTIANTDIKLWKTGATTLASKNSGGATYISNGVYYAVLDATDTNTLGPMVIYVHVAGALAVKLECLVLTAAAYTFMTANTIAADLTTIDDFLDTEIAAIKAKTDALPSDPADASDIATSFTTVNTKLDTIDDFLDTEVAAIKAKTDNLPADPADASDIAASFSSLTTAITTIDDFLDTEVAAIKAKTDNLPSDPADASDIAAAFGTVNAALTVIDDFLDTEIGAIKAKTDLIPASPATSAEVAAILTTAMTEAYPADGGTMTIAQALYLLRGHLGDFSIAGTTLTVKKVDGSTTAATFTLDSASAPTSITRAT